MARGMSTPDQSFSMLLIAKAQYRVLRSDSLLPGTVEKLLQIYQCMFEQGRGFIDLPSSLWLARRKSTSFNRSNLEKSSRRIASESKAV